MISYRILTLLILTLSACTAVRPGTIDRTIYEGDDGDWKGWRGDDSGGFYACGANVRVDGGGGIFYDYTGANGLKLAYCHFDNWDRQKSEDIYLGLWGDWADEMTMCPYDYYIDGARVIYSDGGTALNSVVIHCRNEAGDNEWKYVQNMGGYGVWKPEVIEPTKYVKMANVRFQDEQGIYDDTAMNGLKFRFETPNSGMSLLTPTGYWRSEGSAPAIGKELEESVETTDSENLSEEQSASISATIGATYGFGSVEVTAGYASLTASSVSSTLTKRETVTFSVDCGSEPSPTGTWFIWQWTMDQSKDSTGPGFRMSSNHYKCTHNFQDEPLCPLGFCEDNLCQTCFDWGGPLTIPVSEPPTHVPSPAPVANPPTHAPTPAPGPKPTKRCKKKKKNAPCITSKACCKRCKKFGKKKKKCT
jgi:hypothetical protein